MAGGKKDAERVEDQESDEIKVTDRRMFRLDGELRRELIEEEEGEAEAQEAPVEPVPEPREEAPAAGFERQPVDEPEGVDFTMLINAMAQPALIFLGEIPHPGTGKPEINIEQARLQIDLLDVLRIKCRGNLTSDEEGLLDRMLYQLRMLFVSRSAEAEDPAPTAPA